MNLRSRWLAAPGFVCIAALATMLSAYSGASSSEGNSPVQPVAFRHTIHVDTLKMNCLYCHFSANKSFDPGLPAVGTCMGCHTVIAGSSASRRQNLNSSKLNDDSRMLRSSSPKLLVGSRSNTRIFGRFMNSSPTINPTVVGNVTPGLLTPSLVTGNFA